MNLLKSLGIEDPSWKDLVQLLDAALLALLLIAAAIYALGGRVRKDSWTLLLQAIRDKASEQGVQVLQNATPRELALQFPRSTPQIKQWFADFEAARYGSKKVDIATLKRQFKIVFKTHFKKS